MTNVTDTSSDSSRTRDMAKEVFAIPRVRGRDKWLIYPTHLSSVILLRAPYSHAFTFVLREQKES